MPIVAIGPVCARRGCRYPLWKDGLCGRCWRLGHMFRRDPRMFAYEPLDGYGSERDSVELPWESWQREADAQGRGVADMFADGSDPPAAPR